MSLLSIGEVARRTGRSVDALRWYERQGLIPGVRRDPGGRRTYSAAHVTWLRFLTRLQRTGMSVAAMARYAALADAGLASVDEREAMLQEHKAGIEQRLAALEEARAAVEAKIAFYRLWRETGRRPPLPDLPREI